jgi:urease accessory protein
MPLLRTTTRLLSPAAATALLTAPAWAHHPMGGATPSTFVEGLLSGLGHPIIGLDHLAFVLAVGAVGAITGRYLLPLLFIAASALGVAAHVQGIGVLGAEAMVLASVVACGALLAFKVRLPAAGWGLLLAAAGFFHGYAYGETVVGAQSTPIWAYLLGLAVVQAMIAYATTWLLARRPAQSGALQPRLLGSAVAVTGVALAVLQAI